MSIPAPIRIAIRRLGSIALACLILLPTTARAIPSIAVASSTLLPDTAGQTLPLVVMGGDAVQGMNLHLWIEDGYPDFGSVKGPKITNVDVLTGTIFGENNTGQNIVNSMNQQWIVQTTTDHGSVSAAGLLATITVDTTGFTSGQFHLNLSDPRYDATDFAGVEAILNNAIINVGTTNPSSAYATANYNPFTGELIISAYGVVNVFVQSASNRITPLNPPPVVPVGLLTNNAGRVGITNLGPINLTNFSFGNIGIGLAESDLKLVYTAALGQKGIELPAGSQNFTFGNGIPEPAAGGLFLYGVWGVFLGRRKSIRGEGPHA